MNVGHIIFEQLKYNKLDLMVWGARTFKVFSEESFRDIPHCGGLVFTVSGLKHKGQVMIRLSSNDTYIVEIGSLRKGAWKVKSREENVYVDQLHSLIDYMVEGTKHLSREEALSAYKKANVFIF